MNGPIHINISYLKFIWFWSDAYVNFTEVSGRKHGLNSQFACQIYLAKLQESYVISFRKKHYSKHQNWTIFWNLMSEIILKIQNSAFDNFFCMIQKQYKYLNLDI